MRQRLALLAFPAELGWVEEVAQAVAEEVEGEDAAGHGQGREKDEVGRFEEVGAGGVEHGAPGGGGGLDAEAEEAEGGFGEDGGGHADGGLDENGLQGVGQDGAREQAEVRGAERTGYLDEFSLADLRDLGADEAGVADPGRQGEREDEVRHGGAEKGDDGDGEQDAGQGEKGIAEIDGENGVKPAAVKAGEGAEDQTQGEGHGDDGGGDGERDAGAEDDAGEDVTAEFIGAEEVMRGGRQEPVGEIDPGGVLRGQPGGEQCQQKEACDEATAGGDERMRAHVPG